MCDQMCDQMLAGYGKHMRDSPLQPPTLLRMHAQAPPFLVTPALNPHPIRPSFPAPPSPAPPLTPR